MKELKKKIDELEKAKMAESFILEDSLGDIETFDTIEKCYDYIIEHGFELDIDVNEKMKIDYYKITKQRFAKKGEYIYELIDSEEIVTFKNIEEVITWQNKKL